MNKLRKHGRAASSQLPAGYTALSYIKYAESTGTGVQIALPHDPNYLIEAKLGDASIGQSYWPSQRLLGYRSKTTECTGDASYNDALGHEIAFGGSMFGSYTGMGLSKQGILGGQCEAGTLRIRTISLDSGGDSTSKTYKAGYDTWTDNSGNIRNIFQAGICANRGGYFDLFVDGVAERQFNEEWTEAESPYVDPPYAFNTLYVLWSPNAGNANYGVTNGALCYWVKVTDVTTGELKLNLLPAINPSGSVCLHDTVSKTDYVKSAFTGYTE